MYDITSILIELAGIFLFVRTIVCFWMIFSKAGRHGWEALIPIWNIYVYFKIAGRKNWFWALFITPILWIIVSIVFWFVTATVHADSLDLDSVEQPQETQTWEDPWIAGSTEVALSDCGGRYGKCEYTPLRTIKNTINRFLGMLALILPLVANILAQFGLAKRFSKGVGFGFGLLFLNPIFIGILAFDDSTYNANNTKKSE